MTKRFPLLALLFVMACSSRSSDVRNTAAKGGALGDPDAGEGGKPAATQGNGGSGGADPGTCTGNFRVESDGVCQRWAYDNVPCPDSGF